MDKYTGEATNKIIRISIHSLFRVLNFMLPVCRTNISEAIHITESWQKYDILLCSKMLIEFGEF